MSSLEKHRAFESQAGMYDLEFFVWVEERKQERCDWIAKEYVCPTCGEKMVLIEKNCSNGYIWVCRKFGVNEHHIKRSVRKGNWFEESKLTIPEVLILAYLTVARIGYQHNETPRVKAVDPYRFLRSERQRQLAIIRDKTPPRPLQSKPLQGKFAAKSLLLSGSFFPRIIESGSSLFCWGGHFRGQQGEVRLIQPCHRFSEDAGSGGAPERRKGDTPGIDTRPSLIASDLQHFSCPSRLRMRIGMKCSF
ncbi:hypothetical protein AVEN_1052-1 [Araneus ventricosus]|uniref:Uncharacterized protein n=1 Tax=Araneus ventricosus TaxID=182803 RepID=A0A4Y2KRW5_ARAVE|nr:hypothetical protein AVEN_1052-1 [Araneus ventricosus]